MFTSARLGRRLPTSHRTLVIEDFTTLRKGSSVNHTLSGDTEQIKNEMMHFDELPACIHIFLLWLYFARRHVGDSEISWKKV